MSANVAVGKLTNQTAEESGVLLKLILFTAALAIVPLSSYYLSLQFIWNGNSTFAAITAILAANGVLVAYILMSLREERKITRGQKPESKKTQ